LPDAAILSSPTAHQVGANVDETSAVVTSYKMVSVDIEESRPVTVQAANLTKPLAQYKVACCVFIGHCTSPQWHVVSCTTGSEQSS
jgi:hypothetical protein